MAEPENTELQVLQGEIVEPEEPKPLPAVFKQRRARTVVENITVEQVETYLQALGDTGLMQQSCDLAALGYNTILRLRKEDDDFKALHEEAMEHYRENLQREAHRRAIEGWDEPVFSQRLGTQIGTVRKYDTRLMELMLKRHIPEFRDKFEGEIKISGGVLVAPISAVSPEAWAEAHSGQKIKLLSSETGGIVPSEATDGTVDAT